MVRYGQSGRDCRLCFPANIRLCSANIVILFQLSAGAFAKRPCESFELANMLNHLRTKLRNGVAAASPVLLNASRRYKRLHERVELPLAHVEKLCNFFLAFAHPGPVSCAYLQLHEQAEQTIRVRGEQVHQTLLCV